MNHNGNIFDGKVATFEDEGKRITGTVRVTGGFTFLNATTKYGRKIIYRLSPNAVLLHVA